MLKLITVLLAAWVVCLPPHSASMENEGVRASGISTEDYALYDQVVETTFLTPHTKLVVLERGTVTRLSPDSTELLTVSTFQGRNYFAGRLPPDLVRDFVGVNRKAGWLEGRFQFGVRYRFVSDGSTEEPEVASALPAQTSSVLDRLAFSRVGRTLRNDEALLYVENSRPDGTGAGFLVWFHRKGREWLIFETEVVWSIRGDEEPGEESP